MDLLALRLRPDQDLRPSLCAWARAEGLEAAAIVSGVGSLKHACLRLADESLPGRLPGPFEIVSLVGTLGLHGVHLHIALADRHGHVVGGHLLEDAPIYTTAEVVLGVLPRVQFLRTFDPATGFKELEVRPLP